MRPRVRMCLCVLPGALTGGNARLDGESPFRRGSLLYVDSTVEDHTVSVIAHTKRSRTATERTKAGGVGS